MLFLSKQEVIEIHAKSIAKFGGSPGLRDPSALESALAAAEHRHRGRIGRRAVACQQRAERRRLSALRRSHQFRVAHTEKMHDRAGKFTNL